MTRSTWVYLTISRPTCNSTSSQTKRVERERERGKSQRNHRWRETPQLRCELRSKCPTRSLDRSITRPIIRPARMRKTCSIKQWRKRRSPAAAGREEGDRKCYGISTISVRLDLCVQAYRHVLKTSTLLLIVTRTFLKLWTFFKKSRFKSIF